MASQVSDAENLSRIREILFGSEIEGIENRVQLVKDEISQIIQQFESEGKQKNQELKRFVDDRLLALERLIEEKNLRQDTRLEGLDTELNKIRQHFDNSIDELNKQIESVKTEFQQLNNQNLQLINQLQEREVVMQKEMDLMKKAKVDKNGLADLFNRLAKDLLIVDEDDK